MNWNQVLEAGMPHIPESCGLIIVGETEEGLPFCYEDEFRLQRADEQVLTLTLETPSVHPLEKLHHVCFVEFSYREQGILYYAMVELKELEMKRSLCTLTLTAPLEMQISSQRRYERAPLVNRTPLTCRIIGVREQLGAQGVAFSGQIVDLSRGGISFVTSTRLFCPLYLEFTFVLPSVEQRLTLYGEVARVIHFGSDAYRVAARFRNVPESMAALIDEYCCATAADG